MKSRAGIQIELNVRLRSVAGAFLEWADGRERELNGFVYMELRFLAQDDTRKEVVRIGLKMMPRFQTSQTHLVRSPFFLKLWHATLCS